MEGVVVWGDDRRRKRMDVTAKEEKKEKEVCVFGW